MSLRDYLAAEHGAEIAQSVFGSDPQYLASEAYPDEVFGRLLGIAVEQTGFDPDRLLFDFGAFAAQNTFVQLYPAFFTVTPSAREFLLTVEARIHELVRATIPDARPPELVVAPLGADSVTILYTSPRKLCVLLRGLAEGTARHYGETTTVAEPKCMLRGDPVCSLEVTVSSASA